MRMETLRLLRDVAVAQSFTGAAKLHQCTENNVRRAVKTAEGKFGTPLVGPARHGLRLTPAGKICHAELGKILQDFDQLNAKMRELAANRLGLVKLAVCSSIGLHHLPPLLRRFQQAFPKINVQQQLGPIDRVHRDVLDNEVDLGLTAYPRKLPGLEVELLWREPLVLVCHPLHPFAKLRGVTIRSLKRRPVFAWNEIPWASLLNGVPANERHQFEPQQEFSAVEAVKRAVEIGLGVTVLPGLTVRTETANGTLAAVPFEDGRYFEPLGVIWRKAWNMSPAARQFIQFLKQPQS